MVSQAQQVRRVIGSCGVITSLSVFIWWLSHNHGIDKCQIMLCVCLCMCAGQNVLTCVAGLKDLTYFGEQCEQRVCRGRGEH